MNPRTELRRSYTKPIIDGKTAGATAGLRHSIERLLSSGAERQEADVEASLRHHPDLTRANVIAVISPKGGVGKTTCAFVAGNLLADRLRLRTVVVDANPDYGTLAELAPEKLRREQSLDDVLTDLDRIHTAADLRRYMSTLPTGLHLLAAPHDADLMARLNPESYGQLLALLAVFYEAILLDLGTGVAGPLAQFAIQQADQMLLVSTPEWITSTVVLAALEHLQHEQTTVVANKFHARGPGDLDALEGRLRERRLHRSIAVPYDEQLAGMLDTATYELDALRRPTRLALKRVGLALAEQFV
ncbi:MAG: hypothetical protein QOD71_457 [Thermoleophilaceae bacterium]|nr:hypothetical protein [Thermoleophilaceae bacterium]